MQAAWDLLIHVLTSMPAWLAAVLSGWLLSAGLTQAVKFLTPISVYHGHREQITRLIAMLSAGVPAGMVFLNLGGSGAPVVWVAIGAGLWSPLAFAILQAILKRNAPWLADILSQDVRGEVNSRP